MRSGFPVHVGIIPDGNRRYARKSGLSKADAYGAAAGKALEAVDWALSIGIGHLSAFGVSQENIALRPGDEVCVLHAALVHFCEQVRRLPGVALHLFGDAASLPPSVPGREALLSMQQAETAADARLVVHVGVNYSGHSEVSALLAAVRTNGLPAVSQRPHCYLLSARVPAVDLVIRTGGQRRLSGFLPLQTAYAELWFTDKLWPELTPRDFADALVWFGQQERRLGE
jgi:undecaprenyl diphosphate synthase